MATIEKAVPDRRSLTRISLACGVIGPLLFIVIFLIEGATRPGYSAWHNFVSSLSLSDQGWMQQVNFILCGLLTLCFTIGLRQILRAGKASFWGPVLLAIFSLSLIIAGIFTTDPDLNYPPGSSVGNHQTLHGVIHGLSGLVVFFSVAIACFVLARRFAANPAWKGWALYSIITGILVIVFFIATNVASVYDALGTLPNAPVGLLQRIAILLGWGWIALFALRLLNRISSSLSPL